MSQAVITLLHKIDKVIINPLILLLFAVASLYFFLGIFQFIQSETADSKRDEGKRKILYGIVGMFVMISAFGLIHLVLSTFGIDNNLTYPFN